MSVTIDNSSAIVGVTAKRRSFFYTEPVAHSLDAFFFLSQVGILFFIRRISHAIKIQF